MDKYEKLTQIALKSKIDVSTLLHLTPKEVLFEGGRNISLPEVSVPLDRYYVYGKYGIETVCTNEGRAVKLADGISGTVTAQDGSYIWMMGEDGSQWRWVFQSGVCKEITAKVEWPDE